MKPPSCRSSAGFSILALAIAGVACSSSRPLPKTNDAAVALDLDADAPAERDTGPDVAGHDMRSQDLPSPDGFFVAEDATLPDAPPIEDGARADSFPVKDVAATELAIFSPDTALTDAPPADARVGDSAASDLAPGDRAVEHPLPCAPGMDQTCNDNPLVSSIWGTCQPDGTCVCTTGHVVNPDTGRCMMAPASDAAPGDDAVESACTGEYDACGCGCCGAPTNTACYYPSLGETIAAITAQDLVSKNATNCNLVGCSSGIHYVCCMPAAMEPSSIATYVADGYSGGLDHVTISKSGADCATLSFARPMTSTGSALLRITTPATWGVVGGEFGTCGDAGVMDQAKGALGTLALRASGTSCLADLHVTLFAFAADGTVKTSRLDIDGAAVTGFPAGLCD